jgi:hypothetical protein
MNNSKIIKDNILEVEPPVENEELLRRQETELLEVIEAIESIKSSNYWKTIEKKVWLPTLAILQRNLNKEEDSTKIYRLQGKIEWVSKIADLDKLAQVNRKILEGVRNSLKTK